MFTQAVKTLLSVFFFFFVATLTLKGSGVEGSAVYLTLVATAEVSDQLSASERKECL